MYPILRAKSTTDSVQKSLAPTHHYTPIESATYNTKTYYNYPYLEADQTKVDFMQLNQIIGKNLLAHWHQGPLEASFWTKVKGLKTV